MFTGIIEATGKVEALNMDRENLNITISSPISDELKIDQSLAHDGVCLTVVEQSPGTHTITVRDISGRCGDFVFTFVAIDYPNFFTPNDDGINDTWNIPDLQNDHCSTKK